MRAAIKTGGNPIPITKFGPLHLPVPDQMPLDPRPRFAVAHYLTDPTVYRRWFFPQLENAFGPLWPLILIVAVAAAVFIVWRRKQDPAGDRRRGAAHRGRLRLHAADRGGQEGSPTGFFTNTRYLIPGLILAMVMLPIARPLRAPDRRAQITLIFLGGRLLDHGADHAEVVPDLPLRGDLHHPGPGLGADGAGAGTLAWADVAKDRGGGGRADRPVRGRPRARPAGPVRDQHYTKTTLFLQEGGPQKAYAFAQKLQHKRIGIVGSSEIIFGQYGFFGNPPTNEVDYIGVPGPHGSYRLATTCPKFIERVNAGNYDYLIMSQYTQDSLQVPYSYPVYAWVKNDPAVKPVIEEPGIAPDPDYVFKVEGKLSPRYCPSGSEEEKEVEQSAEEEEVEELEPNE